MTDGSLWLLQFTANLSLRIYGSCVGYLPIFIAKDNGMHHARQLFTITVGYCRGNSLVYSRYIFDRERERELVWRRKIVSIY